MDSIWKCVIKCENPDWRPGFQESYNEQKWYSLIVATNLFYCKVDVAMSQRFIKFIDSEEAHFLLVKHPKAFLLLHLIAKRARRIPGLPDGLEIGEALIGDFKECGLKTRAEYRHALEVLKKRAHIKISETCRTRQKATTGTTTEGTRVKLLTSSIWDINSEENNHRNNHLTTTEQPPNNHEQECKERTKNEKKLASLLKESVEEKDEHFSLSKKQAIGSSTVGLPPALLRKNSDEFIGVKVYCEAHEVDITDKTIESWLKDFDVQMIIESLRVANNTPGVRSKAAFTRKILNDMKKQGKIHAIHG